MSETDAEQAVSLSTPAKRPRNVFRAAVLRALASNRHGHLTVTMPDGERLRFGDGTNPRGSCHGLDAHIRVIREDFFGRCVLYSDIGFAEAYMNGEWDSGDVAEVVAWFILN